MSGPMVLGRLLTRGDRLFHAANSRGCDRGFVEYLCDLGSGKVMVRHRNGAVPGVNLSDLQWDAPAPGSAIRVMRGPCGYLYLSGIEDLQEGDVFHREVRK